jgi:cell division protease FtsH
MESIYLNKHNDVVAKKNSLDNITTKLKARFVGLDYIIDDVMNIVSAWYIFPKAQLRPCIINLWGLTGSGKTALVNVLVDLLDHRKYYAHFDMGEFQSESAKWIKRTFVEDLAHFNKEKAIICLDEFQFARTVDEGNEIRDDKLRMIWEVLDSGKVKYTPDVSEYYIARAEICVSRLRMFRAGGGEIRNGEVISNQQSFMELFGSFFFDRDDRHDQKMDTNYLVSRDFIDGLMVLHDSSAAREIVVKDVTSFDLDEMIKYVSDLITRAVIPREVDLRHAIIFVLGNLDEAYSMSSDLDPDVDPDHVHEMTKKITVADVKNALLHRFRPEQIARLGNNHFIYRAFNSAQFREVIRREFDSVSAFAKEELGWSICFDDSMVDLIYSEGVIATQGTRPVFTTVNNLVQSRVGKIAINVAAIQQAVSSINWSFANGGFYFEFKDAGDRVVSTMRERVELIMASQRGSVDPHIQAHTAVHESGHAILAALLLRIIPSVVVSRSASYHATGFCMVRFPKGPMTKDTLMMDISITLGGLAAEKIVFGEQFTGAGVAADISEASRLANNAIRRFGMGSDPIRLAALMNSSTQDYFGDTNPYEEESIKLVRDCMMIAETFLNRNKMLLLKTSEYLTNNSRMEKAMIEEFVKKFSSEEWVQDDVFVEPEEYYSFDRMVTEQLQEFEAANRSVDKLVIRSLA